ncbi:hypothetical protein [Cognatiyoonia sp. IB215182]|nr:hypothetical protein [Cognatiyoonia sp. IB215182]MDX8355537.1 hypothetical protein [Cognatiyoonia sp. IB215182]
MGNIQVYGMVLLKWGLPMKLANMVFVTASSVFNTATDGVRLRVIMKT